MAQSIDVEVSATDKTRRGLGSAQKNLKATSKAANTMSDRFRQAARNVAVMEGPLGGIAGRLNTVATILNSTNAQWLAMGVAVGAAALAASKLTGMTKDAIEYADAMGKTASKIGITTDALQEMRFAASQTGVEQRTLDTAMQRFGRRLGEAAEGTGVLLKVIEKYGIAIEDSQGNTRSTMDVLNDYADAMQGASSQQERLRMASAAFDMEGVKLVNTFFNGSEGLRKLREEAVAAGVVMKADLIDKAQIMNDAWDSFAKIINTKVKSALISIAAFATGTVTPLEKVNTQISDTLRKLENLKEGGGQVDGLGLTPFAAKIFGVTGKPSELNEVTESLRKLIAEREKLLSGDGGDGKSPARGLTDEQIQVIIERDTALTQLRADIARIADEEEELREDEKQNRKEEKLLNHFDRLQSIEDRAAKLKFDKAERDRKDQIKRGEQFFATMIANASSSNKTFFKIQKLYRISKLAMEAPAAIADAWIWGNSWGGPAAGNTMAAIAAAATATYASQIAGASYGGGGGGVSATGGGGAVDTSPSFQTPTQIVPEEQSGGQVQIVIQGNFIGNEEFMNDVVIPGIQDAVGERDVELISISSRNGQNFSGEFA